MPFNTTRSLEIDLMSSDLIRNKCLELDYAQNLYAALCNTTWQPIEVWEILKNSHWYCSWRSAGRIVSDIRNSTNPTLNEDYMNFYCSGIATEDALWNDNATNKSKHVPEGTVTQEILADFLNLGWRLVDENEEWR
jgi:hypothetical protein